MSLAKALEYKEKKDWNNYLLQLIESSEEEIDKELDKFYVSKEWTSKINFEKILPKVQKLADDNSAKAQYMLGDLYYDGEFVKQDYEKAFHYFSLSANQGDSCAKERLKAIPDHVRIIYELKQTNKHLDDENKKLEDENEKLTTHIKCMPDGEAYFEAKEHYDKLAKKEE